MAILGKIGDDFGRHAAKYPMPPMTNTLAVAEADAITTDEIMLVMVLLCRVVFGISKKSDGVMDLGRHHQSGLEQKSQGHDN